MMARAASSSRAAFANIASTSVGIGTPLAGTGVTQTSACTRSGASTAIRCAAMPPIECPTTEKRGQSRWSASAIASAAISAIVCSPAIARDRP